MRNRKTNITRTTTQGYNFALLNFQQIGDMILHTYSERFFCIINLFMLVDDNNIQDWRHKLWCIGHDYAPCVNISDCLAHP
jgi:hypothetical protein